MHIVTRRTLKEFRGVHPQAHGPLQTWHAVVEHARWSTFADVKRTYNSADKVGDYVVFNVNSYRIVATVRYQHRRVYIIEVLTHSDYDRWSSKVRSGK